MALVVRHRDDILTVATDRGLCVVRWADSPKAHHFPLVTAAMRAAAEPRTALLNVVDARGKLPRFDEEVRRAAAEMARAIVPVASGTAHVLLLEGFTGAAAEGAAWLAKHTTNGHSADSIASAYAGVSGQA